MFRTIANTIMGERACTAKELFSTGLSDNETDAGRDVFFGENIWNFLHNEGGLPRERSRRGKANSKSASALLLELQEHVKGKCHLTHGLEGFDVGSFLHENRVLECNSDVVGVQVAVQRKRALWDSCTTPLLSSPTLS